jgi:hypothetical protein
MLDLPGGEAEGTYARAEYYAPLWEKIARPIFTIVRG